MNPRLCVLGTTLGIVAAAPVHAQQPMPGATTLKGVAAIDATAGSMSERTLLITGLLSPEGILTIVRPLDRWPQDSTRRPTLFPLRARVKVSTPAAALWVNTDRAAVDRDGAVWQGRGVTMALSGGAVADVGPLSVSIRPLVAASQNTSYSPVRGAAPTDLRDPFNGVQIDLPYRFGERVYNVVSPGETWASLNVWKFSLGGTSASQSWGPAHYYPLVLGTEAAGYPRLFVEGREVPVRFGRFTAHWSFGRLETSSESPLAPGDRSRFAAAFVASFSPVGLRGVDFGVTRFFHGRVEHGWLGMQTAMLPFARLFKGKDAGEIGTQSLNQLASVFARVAPPGAGAEMYIEFLREDHNADIRDLVGEPDHASAYTVGVRRAWRAGESVRAVTLETVNSRISHLVQVRPELSPYIHDELSEGHTYLGQPLGSTAALGGGAYMAAFDVVGPHRSQLFEAEIRRIAQAEEGGLYSGQSTAMISVRAMEWRDLGQVSVGGSIRVSSPLGSIPAGNVTMMLSGRGRWFQGSR